MATRQGSLNRVVSDALLVGSNQALFINVPGSPDRTLEIYHINWGYSFLTTPIPVGDFTYGALKVIRNEVFDPAVNYGDAFGSAAITHEMYYQDVIVGAVGIMPQFRTIDFVRPIRTNVGEDTLIIVSAPLSGFAGSFGAQLFVKANYVKEEISKNFPYLLR